ncbi:heavy metal translocating P-type ATPase [Candidatus Leptofilum sp.]|uniref:heavy metal translocating P-type ATPase n=1 Tax=Candidatus Leptofilum sp. TaxID=3241576 RepID=UPI003B5B97B3
MVNEQTFRVTGMDCASCAQTVENGVARLNGVDSCQLNFTTETLRVSGTAVPDTIIGRIQELGYDVAAPDEQPVIAESLNFWQFMRQRQETTLALVGVLLILPGLLFNELLPMLGWEHPLLNVTSVAALVLAGVPIARSGWRSLRINRELTINALMTIAAVGALFIGAYTEAGLVMVLFAIGEALEGYTAVRARNSIRSLMSVSPQSATVLRPCIDCQAHLGQNGYTQGECPFCGVESQRVPVEEIELGETVMVKPGERVPVDGRILSGSSTMDQSTITGESAPIAVQPEDTVFASSINGAGVLHLEVTHLAKDSTISRLIRLVEEAQERRAPAQRFIDRFARVYTPAVVGLALLVAVLPPLIWQQPFIDATTPTNGWLYRALALLVVACPCALVISIPVSLVSALSNAAKNGVLIKGGAYLEALSQVKLLAFDKTGTLTQGKPTITHFQSIACQGENCEPCHDLLGLAHAVEKSSEHPLAQAVAQAAATHQVQGRYPAADNVQAHIGAGIAGTVNNQHVLIGSHRALADLPHESHCDAISAAEANGLTTMLVTADEQYLGYLTVADQVREDAATAVSALHQLGLQTAMLTGDNEATAQNIAKQTGIARVFASLLPAEKVEKIEQLREEYGRVAMLGDGINDAPALAAATVGIAMGAAGTDQAMETADIALMHDDLSKLPFTIRLSQAAMRTVRTNIALSLGLKAAFLVAVLLGFGTMWLAVLADMGASLLVTLNGIRLTKFK